MSESTRHGCASLRALGAPLQPRPLQRSLRRCSRSIARARIGSAMSASSAIGRIRSRTRSAAALGATLRAVEELHAQKRIPSCLMCEYMVMPHEVKQVFGAGDILDVRAPAPLSLPPGPARDRATQPSLRLRGIFRWDARSFISKSRWRISSAQAVATTSAARPPAASRRFGSRSACSTSCRAVRATPSAMGWGWSVHLSGPDRLCMAWLRYPLRCKSASAGWLVQSSDALPHRLPYVWRRVLLGVRNAVPLQRLMRSSAAPPAPPLHLNAMSQSFARCRQVRLITERWYQWQRKVRPRVHPPARPGGTTTGCGCGAELALRSSGGKG